MAETIYPKRAIFPKNEQNKFLLEQVNKLDDSWVNFAKKMNIHQRTLNDWKREQYSIPLDVVQKICKTT